MQINNKKELFPARKSTITFTFQTAFILAVIFDYLFYDKALGISFPLFISIAFISFFFLARKLNVRLGETTFLLAIPLFFFSFMVFFRESRLLTALNAVATISVSILMIKTIRGKELINYFISDYVFSMLCLPFRFLSQGARAIGDFISSIKPLKNKKTTIQVAKGIIMALPMLLLFGLLFASADLVFRNLAQSVFDIKINTSAFSQGLIIILATIIFSGAFFIAFKSDGESDAKISTAKQKFITLGIVETTVFLGCISLLFLGFIGIQFAYFFGGANNIGIDGFTYAEYARKGFFELLMVAVLSFFLLWFSERAVVKKGASHTVLFKTVSGIMILQVLIIMLSAFLRLTLYEEAFGFTTLRLYSHVFTLWLACIFLAFFYHIAIARREERFAFIAFVSMIAFLMFVNFLNPDAFIARQNIARFNKTGKLDGYYLTSLSSDAVPAITEFAAWKLPYDKAEAFANGIERMRERIDGISEKHQWQSLHFSRMRAQSLLHSFF